MSPGEIVVLLILAAVAGLAVRSLWKTHRTGGHCSGDCSQCSGCHHK